MGALRFLRLYKSILEVVLSEVTLSCGKKCIFDPRSATAFLPFGSFLEDVHLFQDCFFQGWFIFPGSLMHLKNSFVHGLSPPKSFIKKLQPDQKLWLFQNRVQVAPSTSCLPGSRGFLWGYSCFQGLYDQNTKAIRSKKAKQSAKTKVKLRFNLGLT